MKIRFNYNLRRALEIHKYWLFFPIWTTLRPRIENFLHVFKCNVMNFLCNFGVISINSVIRVVRHFVGRFDRYILFVDNSAHVQFNLYQSLPKIVICLLYVSYAYLLVGYKIIHNDICSLLFNTIFVTQEKKLIFLCTQRQILIIQWICIIRPVYSSPSG